ncbi:storkhead-box protein 2 [Aphis gossypii]|uniref:storkhead-box protein 2 n=1 Tax=Aphis gossypii TaxID=80765 RepID=UPI00215966B7|nr:storkhead-box protein 2 [Aphis gossypii]XP_050053942.1 storkhead-box protein 2 [Aphis gossypii]XP_050053943.1 storkhead-box protein 2 [Aphis gossypii]
MSARSNSRIKSPVGCRCHYILKRCMAIHLQKQSLVRYVPQQAETSPYWMYDNGYLIFQSFLESNLKCVWNRSLVEAMQVVKYEGYVSPGVLLLTGDPCSMEVIRGAWCRNVLRPPNSYVITKIGDVEDCVVEDLNQGQFTPLSEALCLVILELTSANQNATIDTVRSALKIFFSNIQPPSEHIIYDTMVNLMSDNKIYQTSRGYFVVTPEVQRLVGSATASPAHSLRLGGSSRYSPSKKGFLMSTEEAYMKVHGDIETLRDGDQTHQNIQTNLADIISGGNSDDKTLSPRRDASGERLGRRNSLRTNSASRRFQATLQRSGSMRQISNKNKTDECYGGVSAEPKKSPGIFSRLFGSRRSSSKSRKSNNYCCATQFPPDEWFNKSVQPQHSISTQTEKDEDLQSKQQWPVPRLTRSATLPRKSRTVPAGPSSVACSSTADGCGGCHSNKTPAAAKKAYPSSGSSGYNSLPRMNGGRKSSSSVKNSPSSELSYKIAAGAAKAEDAKPDTPTGRGSNFDSSYSCDEISVNDSSITLTVPATPSSKPKTAADLRREYFRGLSKYGQAATSGSCGTGGGGVRGKDHHHQQQQQQQQQQLKYFNHSANGGRDKQAIAASLHKYLDNACKIK